MLDTRIKYKTKIQAICEYFNVSSDAAKYIYHRRRRGKPFKTETDPNYLEWSNQLHNACICADKLEQFCWDDLIFGQEAELFNTHQISIETQDREIKCSTDKTLDTADDDGWTVVNNKPKSNKKTKNVIEQLRLFDFKSD